MLQIISLEKLKIYKKKNVRRYTYILYYLLYLINKIFFLKRCYFFGTHIDRQLSCIKFRKRSKIPHLLRYIFQLVTMPTLIAHRLVLAINADVMSI